MYPSDYGYASSGSTETCNNTVMYDWDSGTAKTECAQKSWLLDENHAQWTITPVSDEVEGAYFVYSSGFVRGYFLFVEVAARPVLYLKSDTKIVGGLGTFDEPYELGV